MEVLLLLELADGDAGPSSRPSSRPSRVPYIIAWRPSAYANVQGRAARKLSVRSSSEQSIAD